MSIGYHRNYPDIWYANLQRITLIYKRKTCEQESDYNHLVSNWLTRLKSFDFGLSWARTHNHKGVHHEDTQCISLVLCEPSIQGTDNGYIGYTVNANRRLKNHNLGKQAGGALRTDGKGPWEMRLIVHGFPNKTSGLRFESAWQRSDIPRRLKHLTKKDNSDLPFDYRFRILSELLRTAPWNRLALTIRWQKPEFKCEFSPDLTPPEHMAVVYGPVKSKKVKSDDKNGKKQKSKGDNNECIEIESADVITAPSSRHTQCAVCMELVQGTPSHTVRCYHPKCSMTSHMLCLSKSFLSAKHEEFSHILPVEGACPKCRQQLLWGDVIRHKHLSETSQSDESDESDDDHSANELLTQVM